MSKVVAIIITTVAYLLENIDAACEDYQNSEWKIKGTNCGKFCADLLNPEMLCEEWRYTMGCFCKDGFYRDKNLQCVTPEDCGRELNRPEPIPDDPTIMCPENERYDNCSSRCLEQCKNREDPILCPINCDTGCFCRGARLRNNDGICIPLEECEILNPLRPKPVCPKGELFLECGNRCQELCPNTRKAFGIALDCNQCESGCFCEPGLLRGKSGACLHPRRCDKRNIIVSIISTLFNVINTRLFGGTELGRQFDIKFG